MTWLFVTLITLAAWLSPDDPAWVFMLLVIAVVLIGEAAALSLIIGLAELVDRWRARPQLTTDWRDDPLCLGDYVELPRNLDEGLR
jgi:hypothetical protein